MRFKFSSVTPFLLLTFISSSLILPCYAQQSPSTKTHHHHHHHHHNNNNHHQLINHDPILEKKDFEIIIGGGDANPPTSPPEISPNCPPPPPPPPQPCPPPPQPPPISPRVVLAGKVIRAFKAKVTYESCGYKNTWNGLDACKYKGFKCTYSKKHKQQVLYSVQFNGCGFTGDNLEISDFINKLPDISIFHANSNNFTGTIPSDLDTQTLPYLYELDLSNNKYMGDFPMNVLKATQLTFLDLRFNFFSGRVPPEIFTLDVIALFINNNKFEQELPENLGSTPAAFLTLANNKFTGHIPNSIGLAANLLYEVLFLNNELTGCLPYEIGLLKKARVFDVEGNYLTGPIPHSFACLGNMQYLIMARNKFYGPIPEFVCTLPKLRNLTMHDNYFTQVGPECMKLIRKRVLDVKGNCILGLPDQKSPEECDWFFNQPKYCQEEARLYQYVPCKGSASYLDGNVTVEAQSPRPALTYGALRP